MEAGKYIAAVDVVAGGFNVMLREMPRETAAQSSLGQVAQHFGGRAQIVITVDAQGVTHLRAFADGRNDASYARMTDARLLSVALPELLEELRAQIQGASGSSVTA